jgi:dihydropteroate synthase
MHFIRRPAVMGIVNVTPDSFSDGGRYLDPTAAVGHGLALAAAGADVLDVGGESTRPGAVPVTAEEEKRRVLPVVRRLAAEAGVPVSIDTTKAVVAAAALEAGAEVVNDVSAGRADPDMLRLVAGAGAGYVVMHMQGTPATMQLDPTYADVVAEVGEFLRRRLAAAVEAGIDRSRLVADPGIGFGKTAAHNFELLAHLPELSEAVEGTPVLVGTSRKAFIGSLLVPAGGPVLGVEEREEGTLATGVWALDRGAAMVRVHDVRPAVLAVRLLQALEAADPGPAPDVASPQRNRRFRRGPHDRPGCSRDDGAAP